MNVSIERLKLLFIYKRKRSRSLCSQTTKYLKTEANKYRVTKLELAASTTPTAPCEFFASFLVRIVRFCKPNCTNNSVYSVCSVYSVSRNGQNMWSNVVKNQKKITRKIPIASASKPRLFLCHIVTLFRKLIKSF